MKQRVISGVMIAVLVVVLGLVGNSYPLAIVMMACGMIGFAELCRACGVAGADGVAAGDVTDAGGKGNGLYGGMNGLVKTGMLMTAVYYAGLVLIQYFDS